jgi:exodeoxyribonuclease V alpha subunit
MTVGPVETLQGSVEALYYASPGFTAGRLRTRAGEVVSFAGALMVREEDPVVLEGAWERHPKFGRQFKVARFRFDQALNADGLAHYLANHPAIQGIGPVRAKRIAETFGDRFDDVIENEPETIARVARVPMDAVVALREEWLRTRALNASLTWLARFELTHHQITSLVDKFGNAVVAVLEKNPYLLIREVPGFGFKRVDQVARKMGVPKDEPARIEAGIVHCVTERLDQGDCWVDYEDLLDLANALLVIDRPDSRNPIEQRLDGLIADGALVCIDAGGRFLIAKPELHRMEGDLAVLFARGASRNPYLAGLPDLESRIRAADPPLTDGQARALEAAARHSLCLISGGAGVGKTTTVAAIVRLYEDRGLAVTLAAPTGKAAKRLEEVVGREAYTIHRLLGFDGHVFKHGPENLLHADVVIVDEVSMVDVALAWHLLRAIDVECTAVVFVGDHNQLPPVGPGNLLRDLIDRRPIPTVVLDQVVRQAGVLKESSIAVLRGEVRKTAEAAPDGHWPWIVIDRHTDVLEVQRAVLDLYESGLSKRLGFDLLADVQLLTPTKKGPLGTDELNVALQRLLQRKLWGVEVPPPRPNRRPEFLLHDRVIQTRNNYDLGVMNGAIGRVTLVGPRRGELRVRFDDVEVEITTETGGTSDVMLAYAITIHRYQGSEIPCALVVVHKAHAFMHHRNLLYTAVTRARRTAIVVGDRWGIRNCAERQQVERRKTFLSVLDLHRSTEAAEHG